MQVLLFIFGFLLFIGLVVIHEWGHYKAARRNGVVVEEFGIGIPPRAWGRKLKNGMLLSLNWLPLGGFVKMKGENDSDTRKGSFGAASLSAKTKILLAGVTMNLLAGLALLTLLALIGMPKIINERLTSEDQFTVASDTKIVSEQLAVGYIIPGSPAERAGLLPRDIIVNISAGAESRPIKSLSDLQAATSDFAGRTVDVNYERKGRPNTKSVQLLTKDEVEASKDSDNPKGYLGISNPVSLEFRRSTWSAPVVAVGFTWQLVELTFKGLGTALSGLGSAIAGLVTGNDTARSHGQAQAGSQVGGPVAIVAVLWGSGSFGINFLLMIIAILSLTLAIMNILPIPALDGGRLAMTLFSRGILKKPLSQKFEERMVGGSMILILGLIVLITIVDVKRFF